MSKRPRHIDLFETVQRDADLLSGSKLKMIQVLFESLCGALSAAQGHGFNHVLERKLQSLSRAQRIIKGLQLTLDTNKQPSLGSALGQLYSYMGARLWHANVHQDNQAIHEVLSLSRTLSDAWQKLSHPAMTKGEMRSMETKTWPVTSSYLA
jgi:flagellar protein FliS